MAFIMSVNGVNVGELFFTDSESRVYVRKDIAEQYLAEWGFNLVSSRNSLRVYECKVSDTCRTQWSFYAIKIIGRKRYFSMSSSHDHYYRFSEYWGENFSSFGIGARSLDLWGFLDGLNSGLVDLARALSNGGDSIQ